MEDNFVFWILVFFVGSALLGGLIGGAIAYFSGWGWLAVWLYAKGGAQVGVMLFFFGGLILLLIANRRSR